MFRYIEDYIIKKYSAYSYRRANKINKILLSNKENIFKKNNEKKIADLIYRSLVSYHNPWRKLTSNFNIIFNSKGVFNDEIFQGLSRSPKFSVFQYSRKVNRKIANEFFPDGTSHFNYLNNDPKFEEFLKECEDFFSKVFYYLGKKINIDAWLSGNFGAFDEQPMAKALIRNNTKFFSFHKECMLSPGWKNYFLQAFKNGRTPFKGNKIIVFNELSKELIIESGLCSSKKIDIFGMVRLDNLHEWRKKNVNKKLFKKRLGVFFTQPTAQLPTMITDLNIDTYINKSVGLRWSALVKETNKKIYEIAIENEDIEIVVKPKFNDEKFAKELFKSFGKIPKNLIIANNYYDNAEHLIKNSDLICAFNSTAVLESIAGGIPVVIPNFGEVNEEIYKNHILDFFNVPFMASSPEELKEIILENLKKMNFIPKELSSEKREVLKYWTNNPDGDLGKEMPKYLEKLIFSND